MAGHELHKEIENGLIQDSYGAGSYVVLKPQPATGCVPCPASSYIGVALVPSGSRSRTHIPKQTRTAAEANDYSLAAMGRPGGPRIEDRGGAWGPTRLAPGRSAMGLSRRRPEELLLYWVLAKSATPHGRQLHGMGPIGPRRYQASLLRHDLPVIAGLDRHTSGEPHS